MEPRYNILSVHNFYQIRGGEDTVFANEMKLLEENGHKVITYTRHNSEIADFSLFRKLLLPFTTIFNPRTYRDVKRLIREQHIDIVHVHNTLALISPAVYYAALSCGVPVVQTVHNQRLMCPEGTFTRGGRVCEDCLQKGLACALRHRCYRGSFSQTLISVLTLKIHRRLGTYRRIHYIFMTDFFLRKLSAENRLTDGTHLHLKPHFAFPTTVPRHPGETYVVIGRVTKEKGMGVLLDAFAMMPDKRLVIVGAGHTLDAYRTSAKQRGLHHVCFEGYCSRERINELLSRARALIVASQTYETFGMTVVEAYANGVPVIAGKMGGFPELVKEGETGLLFTHDSAASLCETIRRFEQMQGVDWEANARSVYRSLYSPENNYRRLIEVYRKARGLKVLISLTDQSFRATKSVGIYNVSIGLTKGLAQCADVTELHILANNEIAPLLTDMPPHVHVHLADKVVPVRYGRLWWDQVGISQAVREIQPDWVLLPKGVPPFFPRMGKAKLACYVHDVNWEYYAKLGKGTPNSLPRYQHLYFKSLLLRALRISDLVLTSTQFNKGRYLSYESRARTEVVGIGFDHEAEPFRSQRGSDVLFYSSPYPHKLTELGVQRVSAWLNTKGEEGKSIRIHVIGGQIPNFAFPDERWIPYGRLPETEMRRIMTQECRVAVYFSAYEGYGMPPVECLRAGIPCVASDLPPIRENIPAELLFDNEKEESFFSVMNHAYALTELPNRPAYPTWQEVAQRIVSAMQRH